MYAERLYSITLGEKDGVSHRDRIEGLLKRTRDARRREELEAELELPRFPIELEFLWIDYHRLRRRKSGTGFGPAAVEWGDIDAFCRVTSTRYSPWEISVIEALDEAYLTARAAADQPSQTDG